MRELENVIERAVMFARGLFLACPVERSAHASAHDETESILDCRAFTVEEIRAMIAENQVRDANTLGICARLAARGFISLAPRLGAC